MSPVGAKRGHRQYYHSGKLTGTVCVDSDGEDANSNTGTHVQNVPKQHVYVFGNGDDCIESDQCALELNELRPRKFQTNDSFSSCHEKRGTVSKDQFIERKLADGDTLPSLALQYGCTVAELKQANNIFNNQDFFAFKSIKIPVHKYSFLLENGEVDSTDIVAKRTLYSRTEDNKDNLDESGDVKNIEISSPSSFDDSDVSRDWHVSQENIDTGLTRTVSIGTSLNGSEEGIEEFLTHMDKDIMKICNKVNTKKDNLEDVISTLTVKCVHPALTSERISSQQKRGFLDGISWKAVVICICIVAVLCPLIYILYLKVYKKR